MAQAKIFLLLGLSQHLFLLFAIVVVSQSVATGLRENSNEIRRDDFPKNFVFGAGASAFQAEGAAAEDGRTPSIWDTFTHSGNMEDKSNADTSADQYHRYKEDVKLMSDTGLEAYRLSISWSRLLPNGRGAINSRGLKFYNNFIDELIAHGIEPHVTIFHFDLPQVLEDEYKGWLSPRIVDDFKAYADVCFREFGDRVAHWTTLNEPNIMSIASYSSGAFPPQRCTPSSGHYNCTAGNSSVEPYIVTHHALLAHSSAVRLYKEKYQAKQKGQIGLNILTFWFIPYTNSRADVKATQRALDFFIGWMINPLVFGDYPEIMKKNVGSRLPTFTKCDSELVKGAFDFLAMNHYSTVYIEHDSDGTFTKLNGPGPKRRDFNSDIFVKIKVTKGGMPLEQVKLWALPVIPSGLTSVLGYMDRVYGNPPIYIQENGLALPYNETFNDIERVNYLKGYINATLKAIRDGTKVKGYFVWSFLDVFELLAGHQAHYGLYHVAFDDKELTRRPKLSANWYSKFLRNSKEKKIEKAGSNTLPLSAL